MPTSLNFETSPQGERAANQPVVVRPACVGLWRVFPWAVVLLAGILLAAFCRNSPPSLQATPYRVRQTTGPLDPDWAELKVIFAEKCIGCHRPGTRHPDLTSYEALMKSKTMTGEPIVVPGKPKKSPLWQELVWNHADRRQSQHPETPMMPPDALEWFTAEQLKLLSGWIRRGAPQHAAHKPQKSRPLMETDFPSAKQCKACHPRQYRQWSRSMHAYAMESPVTEAFNLTLQERTGGTIGTFCTRCHAPQSAALGENGNRRNVHRSRIAMEGVTCVVCHRVGRPYYKASTRMAVQPGGVLERCMYGPFDDSVSGQLQSHASGGSSYLRSSAFCGACHDVTIPSGTRLEEAFSEWQNSPAAEQGITCQNCHMGPEQGVPVPRHERPLGRAAHVPGVDLERIPLRHLSDHTFAGPDYSLLPDTEFPHKLDWMYETDYRNTEELTPYQKRSLRILRRKNRRQLRIADQKRYELLRNAAEIAVDAPRRATAGSEITIHVDVTSKVAGHNFPTGFTAERQAWVAITVWDPSGRVIFSSGDLDKNGDLRDAHSHAVEAGRLPYDRHLLNFQSKFVALTNRGTERSVILSVNRHLRPLNVMRPGSGIPASFGRPGTFRIAKGSLPPLSTAGQDYPVGLPERPGDYRLRVRLNFRHLPPVLLDKIGIPQLKSQLEVVVIDQFASQIRVVK